MTTSVVIKREHAMIKVTFVANTCESDVIDVRQFAGGNIHLPSTWTTARLAFKLAPNEDGTFQKHYDEDGVRIEVVTDTAGLTYAMPSEFFPNRWFRFWSQSLGTDVDQTAKRVISLGLKG